MDTDFKERPRLLETFFGPEEVSQLPRKERFSLGSIRTFLTFYKPHRRLFFLDLLFATGIAVIDVCYPMISRYFLQDLLPMGEIGIFPILLAILILLFIIRGIFQYIVTYWGHFLGVRMETDMRDMLFSHIQDLSFSFFDRTRTGHLLSRIVSDLFDVVELAHHGPEDLLISILTFIGSFIFMLWIRWELALLLLIFIPIVLYLSIRQRKRMQYASRRVKETTADINASIESSISGAKLAQAFTNEDFERDKLRGSNYSYRDAKGHYYRNMAIFQTGIEFTTGILNVFVITIGGAFVLVGRMDFVDLMTFTLFVNNFVAPIRKLVGFFEQYTSGMAGFERFSELMRLNPEIEEKENAVELESVRGSICFKNVDFSYSDDSDDDVLHALNLEVPQGQTLALVGPSGGGKSTICQLIPRFYDVDSGTISIDGQDIRDVTLQSLRRQVGIVQQEVFIFADTVRNNIRYGRLDATEEEIYGAAKSAEIHQFIMSLPDGYDTLIGERGANLSGGQRQRIAIARVFLKDPAILLLDEATSALDTRTEVNIQASLDRLAQGRTTVIIAHRLSTVRNADSILYIEDGQIQEEGTHNELMDRRGKYYELQVTQVELSSNDMILD